MASCPNRIRKCLLAAGLLALSFSLASCVTISGLWSKDEDAEESDEETAESNADGAKTLPKLSRDKVKSGTIDELELKQARLFNRVEELERKITRQRQRIRVLERGLLLGIVPDELKGAGEVGHDDEDSDDDGTSDTAGRSQGDSLKDAGKALTAGKAGGSSSANAAADSGKSVQAGGDLAPIVDKSGASPPVSTTSAQPEAYQRKMAAAHDQFRSGRYGRAIVEFAAIGKEFGDDVDGSAWKFWTARSWSAMKEWQTARQHFSDFIAQSPSSPWAPRAQLELARVETALGLKETATQRLRKVIEDHPWEESAEMARMELRNMERSL